MQTASLLLSLGGDTGNQVMKHDVTAAELAVLRAIHGDEAVTEVEPGGNVKRSHREERARLLSIYGGAKTAEQKPVVESMFPGIAARLFEHLDELDLPASFYKATGHLSASSEPDAPAWPSAPRQDGPTVAEYVTAGFLAANYPPKGYESKSTPAEIEAAIVEQAKTGEPADGEEEDGVGEDMPDADVLG